MVKFVLKGQGLMPGSTAIAIEQQQQTVGFKRNKVWNQLGFG